MRNHILLPICVAVVLLISQLAYAENTNNLHENIRTFLGFLSSDRIPTVEDYIYYYGTGAEGELTIRLKHCESMGWIPFSENKYCLNYISNYQSHKKEHISFYLNWLKSKIPQFDDHKIISIKKESSEFNHEISTIMLGKTKVALFRVIDSSLKNEFGTVQIIKINDEEVSKIFEKEIGK